VDRVRPHATRLIISYHLEEMLFRAPEEPFGFKALTNQQSAPADKRNAPQVSDFEGVVTRNGIGVLVFGLD
jgi:hypothetical protein